MKRKLLFVLCLLLTVVTIQVPALAAGSVSVSLSTSSTTVNSGDTVTITVAAAVDSCGSGGVEVSYDTGVFELVSGQWLLSDMFMSDFSTGSKDGVFAFENAKGISGSAFQFTLKVKSGALLGSSSVGVRFIADSQSSSESVSITVACDHTYSNSCDTTCDSCGAARSITHTWNSDKVTKAATCTTTGTKSYTCKVCGETKTETVPKASHSYDNSCDTACNDCGAVRTISHSYEWTGSGTEHWQACTVCGDKQNQGAHTCETALSADASGHGYKCTVCGLLPDAEAHVFDNDCDTTCDTCGYTRTVTHAFSDKWSSDASGHWYACTICGEQLEKVPHTPGEPATQTTDQICLDCGFIMQTSGNHEHTMAGDWLSNEVGHWFRCACGAYTEPEAHTWDEGTIDKDAGTITYLCSDCGFVKTEEYIEQTQPTVEDTVAATDSTQEDTNGAFPVWIVLAVLLAISLGVNVYFIIRMITGRKRGKFSDQ